MSSRTKIAAAALLLLAAGAALFFFASSPGEPGEAERSSAAGPSATGSGTAAGSGATTDGDPPSRPPRFVVPAEGEPERRAFRGDDPARRAFEAEPRDHEWATPMEKRIRARAGADLALLDPDARVSRVECRTTRCVLTIDVPEEQFRDAQLLVKALAHGDVVTALGAEFVEGRRRYTLMEGFSPAVRPLATNERLQGDKRAKVLGAWAAAPGGNGVPARLPRR